MRVLHNHAFDEESSSSYIYRNTIYMENVHPIFVVVAPGMFENAYVLLWRNEPTMYPVFRDLQNLVVRINRQSLRGFAIVISARQQITRAKNHVNKSMTMQQLLEAEQRAAEWMRNTRRIPPSSIEDSDEPQPRWEKGASTA